MADEEHDVKTPIGLSIADLQSIIEPRGEDEDFEFWLPFGDDDDEDDENDEEPDEDDHPIPRFKCKRLGKPENKRIKKASIDKKKPFIFVDHKRTDNINDELMMRATMEEIFVDWENLHVHDFREMADPVKVKALKAPADAEITFSKESKKSLAAVASYEFLGIIATGIRDKMRELISITEDDRKN